MNGSPNSCWEVPTIINNGKCHNAQTKPTIKDEVNAFQRVWSLPNAYPRQTISSDSGPRTRSGKKLPNCAKKRCPLKVLPRSLWMVSCPAVPIITTRKVNTYQRQPSLNWRIRRPNTCNPGTPSFFQVRKIAKREGTNPPMRNNAIAQSLFHITAGDWPNQDFGRYINHHRIKL